MNRKDRKTRKEQHQRLAALYRKYGNINTAIDALIEELKAEQAEILAIDEYIAWQIEAAEALLAEDERKLANPEESEGTDVL